MNISLTSKMVCKLSSFFCSQLARCIFCRNFPSLRLHLQSCPLQPRTRWKGVSIGSQWEEDRRSSNMQEREREGKGNDPCLFCMSELQMTLPCFRPGSWSALTRCRVPSPLAHLTFSLHRLVPISQSNTSCTAYSSP